MRRSEKEITDQNEIREIIERSQVCRVAMIDGERPYVVPLCFGLDGDSIYIHCAQEGMKIDILRRNPSVCLEFRSLRSRAYPERHSLQDLHQVSKCDRLCKACFARDRAEIVRGLDAIVRQYGGTSAEYSEQALSKTRVIRIDIESMTGRKSD